MLNRFNMEQSYAGEFGVRPLGGLESKPPEEGALSYSNIGGLLLVYCPPCSGYFLFRLLILRRVPTLPLCPCFYGSTQSRLGVFGL